MKCEYCKKIIEGRKRKFCDRKCFDKYYFSQPEYLKKRAEWAWRYLIRKKFNLSLEEYLSITKKCGVKNCEWTHNISIHHKDGNKNNNSKKNFFPSCQNHHMLIHKHKISIKELESFPIKTNKKELLRYKVTTPFGKINSKKTLNNYS